ncbi:MAG: prepilin-type N-terminal cleavage/methylation domain-containing protein [Sedimentisphaerales bacterium]|nr:prepilin-type N-terminal cleavage/methylation domain-containing protein [Sedimentisphaerales bacterium]
MEPRLTKTMSNTKAFTLVELLIALVVTGVLLSAVATLAFAMSSASRASDDTTLKEAQLRQARLWIADLVHNCKLICAAPGNDLAVWQADANNDGVINVDELVYIERGDNRDTLRLCQFAAGQSDSYSLPSLTLATMKAWLVSRYTETYAPLIPACQNVQFTLYREPADAPYTRTRRLTISFGLSENGAVHPYEITVALRAWAGNVLSPDGTTLVSDDD